MYCCVPSIYFHVQAERTDGSNPEMPKRLSVQRLHMLSFPNSDFKRGFCAQLCPMKPATVAHQAHDKPLSLGQSELGRLRWADWIQIYIEDRISELLIILASQDPLRETPFSKNGRIEAQRPTGTSPSHLAELRLWRVFRGNWATP